MSEEQIKRLMDDLLSATYYSHGDTYNIIYTHNGQAEKVESILRKHLLDCHDKELGELRAKVYTYEKIIASSNFAPILENKDKVLGGSDER